ncbi:MAG: UvrD-helicase domain-containing protein, partial [Phycisphaerales bacterium]|nr:UvrD-helicase domain-containing protein [Phycisphaerales bacterium]
MAKPTSDGPSLFDASTSPEPARPARVPPVTVPVEVTHEPVADAAASTQETPLNQAQRKAVDHRGGPVIVLAGPGTGKTRVITARIERLLREGAEPESVLALTFTVKAAEEMRERIAERIGMDRATRLRMGTFHGYGRSLLIRFGDRIGFPEQHRLMDSAQYRRLLRGLIYEHNLFADRAGVG